MTTLLNEQSASRIATPRPFVGHWIEVVSHVDPKYGGLSSSVPALTASLITETRSCIEIDAFCAPGEAILPAEMTKEDITFWPAGHREWTSSGLRQRYKERLDRADGVHVHGLWQASTAVAAASCRRIGTPYILSAHGMLEPWALRSGLLKKLFYSHFVERRNVSGAKCLHALTQTEAFQYRAFGARGPIAVIPNGVTIPSHTTAAVFHHRFPDLLGKRILLFLARLHPKKGLDLLIESWIANRRSSPETHLVIAGPDSVGTQARLEASIREHGLQESVTFTGMLRGEEKWSALCAAECFVLPSRSEGLSVSVLEAMGVGLPVIVTEACNMPEVERCQAGWQIDANSVALTEALQRLFANTPEQNRLIGSRGAELIRERYNWPLVARQMAELYAWVQGGPEPHGFELT